MADYYQTLGVANDATPEQIKKAYRKLARELHPDVAGPEAEEKFKEVQVAYDVLSNPEKRRSYDVGGDPFSRGGGGGGFSGGAFGFQDIFDNLFGGGGRRSGPVSRTRPGQDALLRLDIDLKDAVFGVTLTKDIDTAIRCGTCNGSCAKPGTSPVTCSMCHGNGSIRQVAQSVLGPIASFNTCNNCRGFGTTIAEPCLDCGGEGRVRTRRSIDIEIPGGVETGNRIQMQGFGEAGPGGGPAGDLYFEIRVKKHKNLVRDGDTLHCNLEVPMTAAALGATMKIETLDGEKEVIIPAGTQPAASIPLKGLGVTKLYRDTRGDLLVHIDVKVPTNIDGQQQELLQKLAQLRNEEKPIGKVTSNSSGVFSKLRDKFSGR